jgi:hypothetical protein
MIGEFEVVIPKPRAFLSGARDLPLFGIQDSLLAGQKLVLRFVQRDDAQPSLPSQR